MYTKRTVTAKMKVKESKYKTLLLYFNKRQNEEK